MKNEWIKCSDRLPKKDGRYLAWAKGWFAPHISHYITIEEEDGILYWWHDENSVYEPEEYPMLEEDGAILPTHWMPLPKIPKK